MSKTPKSLELNLCSPLGNIAFVSQNHGIVQGKVGRGAWGRGLVGDTGGRVMVGPDDLGGLFQP